jgi:predicted kinase
VATLHFICGKAASGKTTLARKLVAEHRAAVFVVASDALCKQRLRLRNATKPAGVYYGDVSEATFDVVTRHFTLPAASENFNTTLYDAGA